VNCAKHLSSIAAVLAAAAVSIPLGAQARRVARRAPQKPSAQRAAPAPPKLQCGDVLSFAVLLDRQGFSPGQIDETPGDNFTRAIIALQQARSVGVSGQPDCDTWHALGGDTSGPTVTDYTITPDDAKGPLTREIPRELPKQAALPALGYQSLLEMLGERFHVSPATLRQMNPGAKFAAGETIKVPAVQPFDASAPRPMPGTEDVTVTVSRQESSARVTRADGSLVFFAPVTTGSEHDPLPLGDWKVTGIDWHPPFHYNPKLFWDAKATGTRATIRPGPNNPVGVVWIDLDLEHYGLYGTPEPRLVGHTTSHGCVRLTNWDAAKLAALVKKDTPVLFR